MLPSDRDSRGEGFERLQPIDRPDGRQGQRSAEDPPRDAGHGIDIHRLNQRDPFLHRQRPTIDQHLLTELLAARSTGFQRHQRRGPQLIARTRDLHRFQCVGEPHDLFADGRHQFGDLVLAGSGINPEQT